MKQCHIQGHTGQPVLNLQTMLRTISFLHRQIPPLIPTGQFDEPTLEAVMVFQRDYHPPVTGVVDAGTWDSIVEYYRAALDEFAAPYPCPGYPFGSLTIKPGGPSVHLIVIQAMFQALATILEDVEAAPITAVHDEATVRNVLWLSQCGSCHTDGTITRETWNYLARLYHLFIICTTVPQLTRQELLNPT